MLITQVSALNIEVSFGRCFFNVFPLCTVAHRVIFSQHFIPENKRIKIYN